MIQLFTRNPRKSTENSYIRESSKMARYETNTRTQKSSNTTRQKIKELMENRDKHKNA